MDSQEGTNVESEKFFRQITSQRENALNQAAELAVLLEMRDGQIAELQQQVDTLEKQVAESRPRKPEAV